MVQAPVETSRVLERVCPLAHVRTSMRRRSEAKHTHTHTHTQPTSDPVDPRPPRCRARKLTRVVVPSTVRSEEGRPWPDVCHCAHPHSHATANPGERGLRWIAHRTPNARPPLSPELTDPTFAPPAARSEGTPRATRKGALGAPVPTQAGPPQLQSTRVVRCCWVRWRTPSAAMPARLH